MDRAAHDAERFPIAIRGNGTGIDDIYIADIVKLPELDAPRGKRRGNGLAFIKIYLAAQRVNRSSILFFFYDASTRSFKFKAVKL